VGIIAGSREVPGRKGLWQEKIILIIIIIIIIIIIYLLSFYAGYLQLFT